MTTKKLSDKFSEYVAAVLGEEKLAAVNAINAERNDSTCATHDHCDANELMIEAFYDVFHRDINPASDADACAINAAWAMSKAKGFSL